MKKVVYLILVSILALTFVEAYSAAHGDPVEYILFEENLEGTVSGGSNKPGNPTPDGWMVITQQIITGMGDGDLPGSPVTFTMTTKIRYKEHVGKSFTSGNWTIVASNGQGSISGKFSGMGTEPDEFSGTFRSLPHTANGIYDGRMIYGEFHSQYLEPGPYGAPQRYEALWTGTVKGR